MLPFPGDSTRGVQEEAIAAKTVDTPVWFIRSKVDSANKAALDFYLKANQAVAKGNGVYVSSRTGSAAEVWVTEKAQCPAAIWEKFSGQFKRFMALQLPGRVAKAEDFTVGALISMRSGSTASCAAGWSMCRPPIPAAKRCRWCW